MAPDLAVPVPPAARYRDLAVAAAKVVPLQLIELLLDLGVAARRDALLHVGGRACGLVRITSGALVPVDVQVDGGDGLAGGRGGACVRHVGPARGVGGLGARDLDDAEVVHGCEGLGGVVVFRLAAGRLSSGNGGFFGSIGPRSAESSTHRELRSSGADGLSLLGLRMIYSVKTLQQSR